MPCQYEGNVRRTVSLKRKLALASAAFLGATLVGALVVHRDWSFSASAEELNAAAPPAQSFLVELKHASGADSGTKR
jgi:hypothetical protein